MPSIVLETLLHLFHSWSHQPWKNSINLFCRGDQGSKWLSKSPKVTWPERYRKELVLSDALTKWPQADLCRSYTTAPPRLTCSGPSLMDVDPIPSSHYSSRYPVEFSALSGFFPSFLLCSMLLGHSQATQFSWQPCALFNNQLYGMRETPICSICQLTPCK